MYHKICVWFDRRLRANVFDESCTDEDDIGLAGSRRKFLRNEIDALERTLAKRRSQLQDADKLLRVCNSDLQEAKEEVGIISFTGMALKVINYYK